MMSHDQIMDLIEFFIKDIFIFIWRIIRLNMNNNVAGLFFRFGIKWNIRSSVFAPGKTRTFIFLLLESFAFLKPAIIESPVMNVVPFLHSSDCLGGSILDGFSRDALFLTSSVCVCAITDWGITISLFSPVAIPCCSLSVLLSDSVFCLNWSFLNYFSFSVLSVLIAVSSIQKSVTSSFVGGTCSFISLLYSFDGKLGKRFSGVFSELLFFWLLVAIINDYRKTDFPLSSSLKKCTSLSNKVVIIVPRTLDSFF